MKKFILRFTVFTGFITLLIVILASSPLTSREKSSYLYGIRLKDSLLKNTPSPRLIFIGGSGLAFGLNSQLIKDSLKYNPVNLGLHAAIGLAYILQSSLEGIRKGDQLIVVPEYEFLCGESSRGSETLVRVIACQGFGKIKKLPLDEQLIVLSYIPRYAIFKVLSIASKLPVLSSLSGENKSDSLKYNNRVFDQYGDVRVRYGEKVKNIKPYILDGLSVNSEMLTKLIEYKRLVENKGAKLFIAFPAFQIESFAGSKKIIEDIQDSLTANGFKVVGSPDRYIFADSLLYDTPYHLSLKGADIRTKRLISDLKKVL